MANIYVTKDNSSLYLTNFLEAGDQIHYDWSLSKSYTMITAKGIANLLLMPSNMSHICTAIGLHRIPPDEEITVSTTEKTIFIFPFLLADSTTMNELFPNTSTLTSLLASTSHLIPTTDLVTSDHSEILTYGSGNKTFTLADLDTAVLGGLSA